MTVRNNPKPKPTLHHRWMMFRGHILIALNEVGVVYRNESFHGLLSSGYHPRPRAWNQRFAGCIPIFVDTVSLSVEIRSQDGFAFKTEVNVCYQFNPIKADAGQQPVVAMIGLHKSRRTVVQDMVIREVKLNLAQHAAEYSAAQLLQGKTRVTLEEDINRSLRARLSRYGIMINPASGVIITAIAPPANMAQGYLAVHNDQLLLEMLQKLSPELLPIYLLAQLMQKEGSVQIVDAQLGAMLGQIYQAAGISPLPTAIHLNGQKPTRAEAAAPQNGHAKA